jgi:hypothetical protein
MRELSDIDVWLNSPTQGVDFLQAAGTALEKVNI